METLVLRDDLEKKVHSDLTLCSSMNQGFPLSHSGCAFGMFKALDKGKEEKAYLDLFSAVYPRFIEGF